MHVAKGEITRLDNIVTQFLDALRARAPKMGLASINQVLSETIDLLRPEIENRGERILEKLAPQLPDIPCDAAQIKQVLVNLIRNAMQSMSRGGELSVESGATSEAVWVSISDSGVGIPEEKLNRIFQPFFTTKPTGQGTGLGLSLSYDIVKSHSGELKVNTMEGEGSEFSFILPAT